MLQTFSALSFAGFSLVGAAGLAAAAGFFTALAAVKYKSVQNQLKFFILTEI